MDLPDRLQVAFPFSKREVTLLINTAPRRYKIHLIEKRNGRGTRVIAQPTAELKLVQRWLVSNFLNDLPVHHSATAYKSGVSIRDHALLHAPQKYLLKLDFEDFFPSIEATDYQLHAQRFSNFSAADVQASTPLLFRRVRENHKMVLSIGAPSSPFISNSILFPFDCAVSHHCERLGVRYSRYADDLAFSTNSPFVLNEVHGLLIEICRDLEYPRLQLNNRKTVYSSKKYQRQLTGLILSNDGTVSVGRERKREIRAMAHRYLLGQLSPEEVGKLRGLIAFMFSIDKEFVKSIARMVGEVKFSELVSGSNAA